LGKSWIDKLIVWIRIVLSVCSVSVCENHKVWGIPSAVNNLFVVNPAGLGKVNVIASVYHMFMHGERGEVTQEIRIVGLELG